MDHIPIWVLVVIMLGGLALRLAFMMFKKNDDHEGDDK